MTDVTKRYLVPKGEEEEDDEKEGRNLDPLCGLSLSVSVSLSLSIVRAITQLSSPLFSLSLSRAMPEWLLLVQAGAATCSKGFVKCFPRVPLALRLYCSCHAAQGDKGNFQKNTLQNLWNKLPPQTVRSMRN